MRLLLFLIALVLVALSAAAFASMDKHAENAVAGFAAGCLALIAVYSAFSGRSKNS